MTPSLLSLPVRDLAKIRLAARAWKRRKGKLGPTPAIPLGPENAYALRLRQLAKRLCETVDRELQPLLDRLGDRREDGIEILPNKRMDADPIESTIQRLRRQLSVSSEISTTRRQLAAVAEANRTALNTHLAPVTGGIPIWRGQSAASKELLGKALRENVRLIKSVPAQMLDQVEETLREQLAAGARVETIRKALQERYAITERRAMLIARDQVGKLNAQLVEQRTSEVGIGGYTWRTSGGGGPAHGDERVREGHRELDGTKQTWDDPPVENPETGDTGHPGEPIECRCTAEADVSGFLDAIGA